MPNPRLDQYLRLHGSFPMAYSTVHDDEMRHFEAEEGFIAYVDTRADQRVAHGDPLCVPGDLDALIGKFLARTKADRRTLLVLQCSLPTARKFADHGFNANHMGVETNLDIRAFSTEGKPMTKVRRWINSARNAGVSVEERSMLDSETVETVRAISDEWLKGKANQTELHLLLRPLKFEHEPGTRLFCAIREGRAEAFVIFEPIYREERITGYYADFVRSLDSAPNGALDLIYLEAMNVFRAEGAETLSFGLSPLADQTDVEGLNNPIVSSIFRINYKHGNDMYAYQGLDAHKKVYCDGGAGAREAKFLVIGGALPLNQIMNVFRYIGILPEQSYLASIRFFGSCVIKELFSRPEAKVQADPKQVSGVIDAMIDGVPTGEIAKKSELRPPIVAGLLDRITSSFKKLSPEIERQAAFFFGHFDEATEKLYVKVSNIADSEKEIHFVHNVLFIPHEDGYGLLLTAEVAAELTIKDSCKIADLLRKKLRKKMPELRYIQIQFEPDGAFYEQLEERTLANATDEDFA